MLVLNDIEIVLGEVRQERMRQSEQWGEQNHSPEMWLMILSEEVGEVAHAALEARSCHPAKGAAEWLREYRRELIQVAAVAVAAVESLDRNELREVN